ncbi:MAG: hypothetical protein CFE29_29380 [Bradyrhizobiaceae bacterium PARB1]|jgi:MAC/Perforin domain|nr:MAG: hypothetical protein CFE29_29380 [Bradyrhizobiaceae bacterium PARB1]
MSVPSYPKNVEPNPDAEAIANLVPGAEIIGYGFNIFGNYSFDNALKPLLDLGEPSSWTAPSGTVYQLPANISQPGGSSSSATSSTFATSSAFTSYFQGSASVSGSIGAFSASFNSTYDTAQRSQSDYSWALVEADFVAWHITIDYSSAIVRKEVREDSDWANLPKTFNAKNEESVLAFFNFFTKFGTHFINMVTTGGTLYYYYAISQSSHYSSTAIAVSASAEFHGLISSSSAEASAQWGNTAANWTSYRQSHAVTVPATTDVINWVNPASGSYDSRGNFAQWKQAVVQNPSRCKFALRPIWELFSDQQRQALFLAYQAYGDNRVSVLARKNGLAVILVNGKPMIPNGGYPAANAQAWQLVVLDRKTLAVRLNKIYQFDFNDPHWPDNTLNMMSSDLGPYVGSQEHMLVTATSNLDEACNPNTELYAILKSFGSGPSATACEGFGGFYPGFPTTPEVSLNALLLPQPGGFLPTPYEP